VVLLAFPGGVASLIYQARDRLLDVVARRHPVGLDTGAGDAPPPGPVPLLAEGAA
jgi:hypothetical protein